MKKRITSSKRDACNRHLWKNMRKGIRPSYLDFRSNIDNWNLSTDNPVVARLKIGKDGGLVYRTPSVTSF